MNDFDVSISENILDVKECGNGKTHRVQLPGKILNAVSSPSSALIVVLVDFSDNRPNLFCIDVYSGSILWTKGASKDRSKNNTYTEIRSKNDTEEILVWDWDGYRTVLDARTGEIKESHFFK
jgi:hypothetical protein